MRSPSASGVSAWHSLPKTPTPSCQASQPGNCAANPLALTASPTVACAGRASVRCHTEDADSAWHMHTCSVPASFTVDLLRTLGERIDETAGDAIEHGPHQHFERADGKSVFQGEIGRAHV